MTEGIPGLDLGPAAAGLARHVLELPPEVNAGDLFDLINQIHPAVPPVPPLDDSGVPITTRSELQGPDALPGVGTSWRFVTPRQRGEAPEPGSIDPDGLYFAFEEGLPEDEELRIVLLMLGLARRLDGVVTFDTQDTSGAVQIEPDPDIRIDLVVWSLVSLSPEELLNVIASVESTAALAGPDTGFTGAAPEPELLEPEEHAAVHAAARALDARELGQAETDQFTTVLVPLVDTETEDLDTKEADDDLLVVLAGPADTELGLPRGVTKPDGYHRYEIRWSPVEDSQLFTDVPEPGFVESREFAQFRLQVLTRALATAVDGIIVDTDGFSVDRYDLPSLEDE